MAAELMFTLGPLHFITEDQCKSEPQIKYFKRNLLVWLLGAKQI
jgi:hypothetical protein